MSTTAPPLDRAPAPDPAPPRAALRVVVALAATALAVVAVVLTVGAWGEAPYRALGVSAPATALRVALPLVRAVVVLAAGLTLGSLVAAVGVLPSRTGARALSADGYAAVRRAGTAAALWALAASVTVPLTVVVGTGGDARVLGTPEAFLASVGALEEPAGFLVAAVAAGVVAVMCRVTFSWRTAVGALVPALLAVVAPVATGHVASVGAGHDIATDAAVLTAVALAAWFGTTVALDRHRARRRPDGEVVARRTRDVARVAAPAAFAGLVVVDLYLVRGGWTTLYGLVAGATLVLVVAAALPLVLPRLPVGWTVTALGLAAVTTGLAASGLPPGLLRPASAQETLLGFDLPGPPTVLGLLGPGRVNVLADVVCVALAGLYVAGVLRLRRRGDTWPPGRTVAWLAGCALAAWTTTSGLGEYAMAMFSVHMGSHMLLSMLVPILLVLGGPVTLALRAVPPAPAGEDGSALDGPRAWLLSLLGSPVSRFLTHPVVALVLFVGSFYALYLSPLYGAALPYHWAHQLMNLHFVVTGYLFFWLVIGVDRAPRTLPHVARLALLLASMPFHAFFGVAIFGADTVIGQRFFGDLALPWVPDLLADQSLGGGLAWAAGEVPLLAVVIALLVQWSRHDDREGTRHDRHADRDGDGELAAYNAMLADLARRRH
ncbi:cytochrome c oxidase assembly protein [Actinomycetospora sp. TBRC 11914]|uniref:cytochrome c oxidase assembly protein n=1 Tax=Actinomycetospora sp. TBRC 11914 TaxID=2729387 RepID=UPI00145F86D0|nr:cytochrome c oxidase assembly protein [Actinomycetospora sp. TBRC 11914]NMO92654.1 cytochrome c oxidase assembly protein [Actinomycetospora sp. TBRC 11914]